ncbi:DEAD/DEAH box helicase [Patescibacteria group bacterium]|nr:DEAD/DEAH box helicase [Patescibacteria group bacterium]MBU1663291.1 DEAD/DEAH box helicase [Patescibacteria group bacterium]MBU1934005.1 DEAD/DEAH box helicase [Patescibacteria group bacterium]MBU2008139.1 DEAD/DEAH box helicase [Patescibacteria group bacterium]MBU2233672.1 DEAD/DEAH box helicase [Patescibacteria group bacterium]
MSLLNKQIGSDFKGLGVSADILNVLKILKIDTPTPIQVKSIPVALSGQDMVGVAQTGTGKTFAFGIPMIERLLLERGQGLVLLPTRELASQVDENLRKLGSRLGLRTAALIGGQTIGSQAQSLKRNPHILICTPGRLIDHLKRGWVKLDYIKVLVLDEADRMFDMGFAPQIEEIIKRIPKTRQTLLFSATMPRAILRLASTHMSMPVHIEVAPSGTTVECVDQEVYVMKKENKYMQLEKILKQYKGSVLVFARTKYGAKHLANNLKQSMHEVAEIHSNLSFNQRKESMAGFKSKKYRILIATDIAARGIDVSGIELVVNYDLPDDSGDYVHRIGRTARAGNPGKAISFATPDQWKDIRNIERLINKKLTLTKFAELEQAGTRPTFKRYGRTMSFGRSVASRSRPGGFGRHRGR